MAKSNHSPWPNEGVEPRTIHEESYGARGDLSRAIALLKTLNRGFANDDDAELHAAMQIVVNELEAAHDRLDRANIRLLHEGAPSQSRKRARGPRDAQTEG
jgi:hypothetical protein